MLCIFRLIGGRNVLIASVLYRVQPWSDRKVSSYHLTFLCSDINLSLCTFLGVRHPCSFMHSEGKKERKDLAPSPSTSRAWVIYMRNSASRDLYFQADLSFQKQADTLGTKTDHRTTTKSSVLPKLQAGVCQGEWWSKKSGVLTGKGRRKKEWKVWETGRDFKGHTAV